jgi:hypothetical protein
MLLIVGLASRVGGKNGNMVYPSVRQIAEDTDMSRASVQRWLRHLEEKGLVQTFEGKRESGARSSNIYRLPIKAAFFHPTKGPMFSVPDDETEKPPVLGPQIEAGPASKNEAGPASLGEACSEQPLEQPYEGIESTQSGDCELPLGLPPVPPKDPTIDDLAVHISEEWAARAFATPLRGKMPTQSAAEKAMRLAKANIVGEQTVIDVWNDLFKNIDQSDFLQGKVAGRDGRPPFKLTLSFLLEKRNFEKTLEGRFNGQSTGERKLGSTREATSRVISRIRSRQGRGAGGGNQARALAGR